MVENAKYNGAGVMAFMRDSFGELWVVLGREYWSGRGWCDFGGRLHMAHGESVLSGAIRELTEESIGTVFKTMNAEKALNILRKSYIGMVTHSGDGMNYCMLLVMLEFDNTLPRRFCESRKKMTKSTQKCSRVFLEKDAVVLFKYSVLESMQKSRSLTSVVPISDYIAYHQTEIRTRIRLDLRTSFAALLWDNWNKIDDYCRTCNSPM